MTSKAKRFDGSIRSVRLMLWIDGFVNDTDRRIDPIVATLQSRDCEIKRLLACFANVSHFSLRQYQNPEGVEH
jgi:hypothetical protein